MVNDTNRVYIDPRTHATFVAVFCAYLDPCTSGARGHACFSCCSRRHRCELSDWSAVPTPFIPTYFYLFLFLYSCIWISLKLVLIFYLLLCSLHQVWGILVMSAFYDYGTTVYDLLMFPTFTYLIIYWNGLKMKFGKPTRFGVGVIMAH